MSKLYEDLSRWRVQCCPENQWPILRKELTGETLSLENPYRDLHDPHLEEFEPFDTENMQAVQLSLSTRVRATDTSSRQIIRLVAPVNVGGGVGYSQVYKGRFQPERCCDPDVIVKIYKGSLSSGFCDNIFLNSEFSEWEEELLSYREEAWAYASLRTLQGNVIPHSYGFYEVALPHGEPAIIHVIEYIPGGHALPLPDGYEGSSHALAQVLDRLLGAAQIIAVSKLLTWDIASRNIIWPPLSPDGTLPYPVFIDFNRLWKSSKKSRANMITQIVWMARQEYEFATEILTAWIGKNIRQGSAIVKQFYLDVSLLEELRSQLGICAL